MCGCIWFSIRSFMDSVGFCWLRLKHERNMSRKNFHSPFFAHTAPLRAHLHLVLQTNRLFSSFWFGQNNDMSSSAVGDDGVMHTFPREMPSNIYIINCLSPVLIFFYIFGTTVKSKYPNGTWWRPFFMHIRTTLICTYIDIVVDVLVFFKFDGAFFNIANKLTENENGLRSLK